MLLSLTNAAKGESVLPTLGFILCAYGIYALCRAWTRRHHRRFQPYRQWRRRRRLTLVGGTGVGVGVIILIAILGLPSQYENLSSASIISTSWGHDSWKSGQVMPRQEILPIKNSDDPGQPVYAYLHPETPPAQLQAEKKAHPSRSMKKQRLRKPAHLGKSSKTVAHASKKDKTPVKQRTKTHKNNKKRAQPSAKKLAANSR